MEIDKIYIDEAIRIRRVYIQNISRVNELQPIYEKLLREFQKAKEELDEIGYDDIDPKYNEDYFKKKLESLNVHIENTTRKLKPFDDTLKKLDEEQRILYYSIKEKYPNITDKEMEETILPYVENIF